MAAVTAYIPTPECALLPHIGPLSYDVAASTKIVAGTLVGVDASGNAVIGAATGMKFIAGRADATVDNSTGNAGDLKIDVIPGIFYWANGDSITKSSIGDLAFVSDNHTVTKAQSGAQGVAGVIVGVDATYGVAVASTFWSNRDMVAQPQFGTTTLVAGTKSVQAGRLTSTSSILVTMRDPGAGALTTFIGFSTPVASRNTTTGTFVINAIDNAKATLATAVCTVDWFVIG